MLRRLPIIIFAVVASDFLLLAIFSYWYSWKISLAETGLMAVVGLAVILYYEWRWSEAVANRIESETVILDGWALEKILLLVAGVILVIPGFLTDGLGLLMLMPSVRRMMVTTLELQG